MFRKSPELKSEFLKYLIMHCDAGNDRVPSLKELSQKLGKKVQTGTFAADMKVALVNIGPVTIWIDSKNKE